MKKFKILSLLLLSFTFILIINNSPVEAGGCTGSCTTGPTNVVCSPPCAAATPYCYGTCDSCTVCDGGDPCTCGGTTTQCTGSCWACVPGSCPAAKPICSSGTCYECTINAHCSAGRVCLNNACKCTAGYIWNGASCVLTDSASCNQAGTVSYCPGKNQVVDRGYLYIKNPSGVICNSNLNGWSVSGSAASGGACCNVAGQYYTYLQSTNAAGTIDSTIYASAYYLTAAQACICGNGACQAGENCPNCPGDCPGFNTNNYCTGGKAYGCGYLPVTSPAGNGIQVNNCGQAGATGQYCDTYAQRSAPNTYWTASSIFTTNTGAILCAAGTSTTCSAANTCAASSGYYCSPSNTWVVTNPIISASIACQSGTKYICSAANTCQQAGTSGYYCDTDTNWIAQSRFVRGSTICYDGIKYISNATITVKATNGSANLDQVKIDVVDDAIKTVLLGTNTTDGTGIAGFNMSEKSNYPYRLVSIIASRSDLGLSITERFPVYYNKDNNITIRMRTANECLPDCTRADDDYHLCDPGCDGINGCSYYNTQAKNACTLPRQAKGARRVIEDTQINQTAVYCCGGVPVVEKKNTNISVNCAGGEAIKMTKIVIVDGEPVKMNVIACSERK